MDNVRADLEILAAAPTTPETCWRVADFHRALAGRLTKPEIYHELCRLNEAGLMHQCDNTEWMISRSGTSYLLCGKKGEKTQHTKF